MEARAVFKDKGGRRSGMDRRKFTYSGHIPERRSDEDRRRIPERRSGEDRRKVADRRKGMDRRVSYIP